MTGSLTGISHWRIYYGDGSMFSSAEGSWSEAPDYDVQVVVLFTADQTANGSHYKTIVSMVDYYWKDGDAFGYSFDDRRVCKGAIKYGAWLSNEGFRAVSDRALQDRGDF